MNKEISEDLYKEAISITHKLLTAPDKLKEKAYNDLLQKYADSKEGKNAKETDV